VDIEKKSTKCIKHVVEELETIEMKEIILSVYDYDESKPGSSYDSKKLSEFLTENNSIDVTQKELLIPLMPIEKEELRIREYCEKCMHKQMRRSKHCRLCEACVAKFDHHCFWIGSCVGELNHKKYWLMLGFLSLQFCQ